MIRKYHNHKPQTTPWHREEEPLNHHETPGRQIKQSKPVELTKYKTCAIFHRSYILYISHCFYSTKERYHAFK